MDQEGGRGLHSIKPTLTGSLSEQLNTVTHPLSLSLRSLCAPFIAQYLFQDAKKQLWDFNGRWISRELQVS